MRLIDADAIVIPCDFRIEHFHDRIDEHVAYDLGRAVKKLIDQQPTVDAVEVVRCKDCKWYERKYILHRRDYSWNEQYTECSYLEAPMDDNDYCSYGERMDEVTDETN